MPDVRQGQWPRVTVVMSTYNRPERLKAAVRCVLNQTFKDYELLVVDDGSMTAKDALAEFAPAFEEAGIRMGVLELQENSGYQALPKNVGIAYARGAYIAHADDDDEWYPEHLETLVGVLESGGADVAYGTFDFGGDREGETFEFIPFNNITVALLAQPQTNFISCHTVYSKGAAIAALGPKVFNEELRRFGDWDVYRRMAEFGLRFKGVDRPTYKYVWHGENLQLVRPVNEASVDYSNDGGVPWTGQVSE